MSESCSGRCLICWQSSDTPESKLHPPHSPLERQLNAIFVLRVLLKVSPASLANYFQISSGQHPEHWVRLCGKCGELVENARAAYNQLLNLRAQLREFQKRISDRVKATCEDTGVGKADEDYQQEIGCLVRTFVKHQKYETVNPFLVGDAQANEQNKKSCARYCDSPPDSPSPASPLTLDSPTEIPPKPSRRKKPDFTCRDCGESFATHSQRECHKRKVHRPKPLRKPPSLPCPACDLKLRSHFALARHQLEVHQGQRNVTLNQVRLFYHRKIKETVPCPHCPYRALNYRVQLHIARVHNSEPGIICDLCGKAMKLHRYLRHHQAKEHHKCGVTDCDFRGNDAQELWEHQNSVHGKGVDLWRCAECGKLFHRPDFLRTHQQIHERERLAEEEGEVGVKRYQCDTCGKNYSTKNSLQSHRGFAHPAKSKVGMLPVT